MDEEKEKVSQLPIHFDWIWPTGIRHGLKMEKKDKVKCLRCDKILPSTEDLKHELCTCGNVAVLQSSNHIYATAKEFLLCSYVEVMPHAK